MSDVELPGARVVIAEVGAQGQALAAGHGQGLAVQDLRRAVVPTGHEQLVHIRCVEHALRLAEASEAAHPRPSTQVDDFHGVVLERGHEQALALEVDGQMVQASGDVGQGDRLNQSQRLLVLRAQGNGEGEDRRNDGRDSIHVSLSAMKVRGATPRRTDSADGDEAEVTASEAARPYGNYRSGAAG